MEIDQHAEELASALGIDKEEVKSDLQNLLQYSVPLDEAKQSVRRKHGGGSSGSDAPPSSKQIADIDPDDGNVSVTVRVLTVGTRSIVYQGDAQTIHEGELADESGVISYTAWQDFGFEPGDSVTIGNAGVREWDGKPELNIGASSTVGVESEPVETPYDDRIGGEEDLIDLTAGDRGRTVEVHVLEVESRTIDGRNGETTILSGVVADETGRLPFTDWQPRPDVTEGASLRLSDVYVREFRGVPQVNLSEFTTLEVLDEPVSVTDSAPRLKIGEAVDAGGMFDVEVLGNVLEVRDGSGLIERCPDCSRVVQNGQCRQHGEVDGEDDMRVKAILDDGTGTLTAILDRDITEAIYGGTMADAMEAAREAMDKEVVADEIASKLVGREYRVRGNLSVDEYGANLEADEFEESDDDPAERAAALLTEVRA
ncbi:Single-stranded DNA binding protein [Haloferax mediterranei ATCC 33500]|uniref:Replication factor A n=1 Tax=Haloferax mediterranei (strain ATCC 33500 / DSM 1411 / JCM 8866 / NBRC 14739 / NCIMB 2177 / R-4) TaxID=523841 RepID=I3R4G5_HALMT|nr:Single-stranded DNA binding protein [Haloferax mediterranei]AFK19125.1 replication factor A [Haloferax mediterranei ATCC 33500]AHZ21514.1 replication factor A [Haloferax mediterranei ATCC 33500]EMA03974.1 replication factor A [Haloferax mediterranei ATCC 33500]MDX5989221.1 Single-stranded DNA binding protein [Haloferax mediterranei ATCC 33500]QCQ75597.1 Single-stranded DNA binding protein [Haloferax mediterranei ATCC 33500]